MNWKDVEGRGQLVIEYYHSICQEGPRNTSETTVRIVIIDINISDVDTKFNTDWYPYL
jgi:hypothetical protein